MLTAEKIVETFQKTTGEISLDEAVERLIILERFEEAMNDIHAGKTIPHEQVKQEMAELRARKWAE